MKNMNETVEELLNSFGGVTHTYPCRSFEFMGQTISVGIIRDRAPERCQDDVMVFVNKEHYATLHFPLNEETI